MAGAVSPWRLELRDRRAEIGEEFGRMRAGHPGRQVKNA
jgi:hypothetical protein